jgi:hypothetical protein
MADKGKELIKALFASSSKVFYDRPDVLSIEQVQEELDLREQTDQMLSRARLKLLDHMFPTRTSTTD